MTTDGDDEHAQIWMRDTARLNRTVAAFMRRGLDSHLAAKLQKSGATLGALKQADDSALCDMGLTVEQIQEVRKGARADIPFEGLARVLWANRSMCCVCRQPGLSIIVHHIVPWAISHDHSDSNLAVLCLEHHARAHTKGDLERNLSPSLLRDSKVRWEDEVRHLDVKAILNASRNRGHHWWWFNHIRLFELADAAGVDLTSLERFPGARSRGLADAQGELTHPGDHTSFRYAGGDGTVLYAYVREVLENVLIRTGVFNISDDLDRGYLGRVLTAGDLVLVQGRHLFKKTNDQDKGPGQISLVRRQANGVRVSFTVDRWEAISVSSWATWLAGAQSAASIIRIQAIEPSPSHLHLACTGVAIGSALEGMVTRSYVYPTWPQSEPPDDGDEDWLAGFGDDSD